MREKAACSKTTPLFSPRLPTSCAASSRTRWVYIKAAPATRPGSLSLSGPHGPLPRIILYSLITSARHPILSSHAMTYCSRPGSGLRAVAATGSSTNGDTMLKPALAASLFLLTLALRQQPAPVTPNPAADAAKVNPVKATTSSRAHARKMYGYACAMCPGETAHAKGALSAGMNPTASTDPAALHAFTDGQLFYII